MSRSRSFAEIIELAQTGVEPEAVTNNAIVEAPEPIAPEPMPKVAPAPATATKNGSGKQSKRATLKQSSFYLPPELSGRLDLFILQYNQEMGFEPLDRSDVLNTLLESLIRLTESKGTVKALTMIRALK